MGLQFKYISKQSYFEMRNDKETRQSPAGHRPLERCPSVHHQGRAAPRSGVGGGGAVAVVRREGHDVAVPVSVSEPSRTNSVTRTVTRLGHSAEQPATE